MTRRYAQSEALLARALKSIPLGSQTFSKSLTQYPHGVSPYFIERGDGCHVWDVDGHRYIDCVSALAAITLGYNDPDVRRAVTAQLEQGSIFSLPHRLEIEVAEAICDAVPCAEQVRFGKNGSDATSGAIRLCRAITGRTRVAVCGYHGWQDWYIGSTARHKGVPDAVRALTHPFPYNDLAALGSLLDEHNGEFAAVILEPMNVTLPQPGYLEGVKALTHRHGALLVFDETVTGFRYALGGAQARFGVTPDLATFGKGLANGFPLSAIAGRRELMKVMEDIFFSFTFGGETLSLAAAKATLAKLRDEPVFATLESRGQALQAGLEQRLSHHALQAHFSVSGLPAWTFLVPSGLPETQLWEIKTLMIQEMLARGILWLGSHNLNYAHSAQSISEILAAYDEVLSLVAQALAEGDVRRHLRCAPLQPLFKVR